MLPVVLPFSISLKKLRGGDVYILFIAITSEPSNDESSVFFIVMINYAKVKELNVI